MNHYKDYEISLKYSVAFRSAFSYLHAFWNNNNFNDIITQ